MKSAMNICRFVFVFAAAALAGLSAAYAEDAAPPPPPQDLILIWPLSAPIGDYNPSESVYTMLRERKLTPVEKDKLNQFLSSPEGAQYQGCLAVACMSEIGRALGAKYSLGVKVEKEGQNVNMLVFAVDANAPKISAKSDKISPESAPEVIYAVLEIMLDEIAPQIGGVTKAAASGGGAQQNPNDTPPDPDAMKEKDEKEKDKKKKENAVDEKSSASKLVWKGDLTTIGPMDIIVPRNRVGAAVGYRRIFVKNYVYVDPTVDMHFFSDKLAFSFDVPLNIEIFDGYIKKDDVKGGKVGFQNAGRLRPEDWNEWRDYFKVIHYIRYGKKEDSVYINVNRDVANTLGHGLLMKRYIPSLEAGTYKVSAVGAAYNDWGGFELYSNDITSFDISGGLVFVKPLALFFDNFFAKSISIGGTVLLDRDAPVLINPEDIDTSNGRFKVMQEGMIMGYGVDVEAKVFRTENIDAKLYFDFSHLKPLTTSTPSAGDQEVIRRYPTVFLPWLDNKYKGGWGYTLGSLVRLNFGEEWLSAFRMRGELRYFADNFDPEYFDPLYEIQKYKYVSEHRVTSKAVSEAMGGKAIPSKFVDVFGRTGPNRFGGMLEFTYALKDIVGVTLMWEDATGPDNGKFIAHVEVPALSWLRLSATYYKWNFDSYSKLFNLNDENAVLITSARVHPLPLLYFNLGLRKALKPSDKYVSNLDSAFDVRFDVEFSWEWDAE